MPIHFNHQSRGHINPLQARALKEAFLSIYAFCGASKEDHLIFTSSGAESVNHVVFAAYLDITRKTGKNHFLCSALDEAPAIMAMSRLQECNSIFQMIPATSQGKITKQGVAEMITPRTALISISWANGLTGVIQPVLEIAQLCQERGILFHVDATHVLGKGDFFIEESGADLLSFNGPFGGSGFLLIRSGVELSPFILGGSQQAGMRAGAYHVPSLIELGKWTQQQRSYSDHYGMEIARLKTLFEKIICKAIPNAQILFYEQERLPYISSLLFPGITNEALCYALHQKGIHAVIGGGDFQHFSHVLKGCGIDTPDAHCAISFAFTHTTEEDEIREGAQGVIESVLHLQKYSKWLFKEIYELR